MQTQAQMKVLAREALKLVKDRAPAIVEEQILARALDEVAEFTGDIMGKLTNLDAENDKGIVMARLSQTKTISPSGNTKLRQNLFSHLCRILR